MLPRDLLYPLVRCSSSVTSMKCVIMVVFNASKVDIWSWPQQPTIILSVNIENALSQILMLIDHPPMQDLSCGVVQPHPVPLPYPGTARRRQHNLLAAL